MTYNTTVSVVDETMFSVITLKSNDQYNLYFETAFDTAFTSASYAPPSYDNYSLPSYNMKAVISYALPSYDIDSSSSTVYDEDFSAGNDSPVAITIMTTAVKMMTNDMNATVYFAVIDAESSAGNTEFSVIIMMTTVSHELFSAIHNGIFSTVADAVTRITT